MKVIALAVTNIRRRFRRPASIFFALVLPMLLILLLGSAFGGQFTPRMGVVGTNIGELGEALVTTLEETDELEVVRYESEDDLRSAVERGRAQAGLVIPSGYDRSLRAGETVTVSYVGRPDTFAEQLRAAVLAATGKESALVRAARFAEAESAVSFDEGFVHASTLVPGVALTSVKVEPAGEPEFLGTLGKFDRGASSQLLLFLFLSSLTGSIVLIQSRELGVTRRMLSTPTSVRTVLAGDALGWFGVVIIQGVVIMVGSMLIFGVSWGDPGGAIAVLVAFALAGSGAGMLLGSLLRTEQQAVAVGILVGLGAAALGGSMVPLELFPSTVSAIARATPHAWGNNAFDELVRRGGGIEDTLDELGVLLAFAFVLLTLGVWRLRRALT